MLSSLLWTFITHYSVSLLTSLGVRPQPPLPRNLPSLAFSEQWQVLGPFQIGTREAAWGADPLEYYGGFHSLRYNENAAFRSSLAANATVSWSQATAKLGRPETQRASAELSVDFPDIDWTFLQLVYGWTALQWQGWARGEIIVQAEWTKTLAFYPKGVLDFWVDDEHYWGGDFYRYSRAPLVLHLEPGVHQIDVRLVRDVRTHGGITDNPSVNVELQLQASCPGLSQGGEVLLADTLNDDFGPLASSYMSVVLRNDHGSHGPDVRVDSMEATHNVCEASLVSTSQIVIIPGQSRPVAFQVACVPGTSWWGEIQLQFKYTAHATNSPTDSAPHTLDVSAFTRVERSMYEPHKFTFMHPSGMVSYAILRPPSQHATCANLSREAKLPIFLMLHGAGLEADSDLVAHALDPLPDLCTWVLFPTGATPWSGDDWHTWGFAEVEAAVAAIPDWIEQIEWSGPGVDTDRWLVTGHSNGGQGTWYALTHRPDKVFAAAPVSGYSSIQNYVPYTSWHAADPGKTAVLQGSLNSYRHELLLENAEGIPVLQQHGSEDDNVPAYNSRLLSQLIQQAGADSWYLEMPGQAHWWNGVMTTKPLSGFYKRNLDTQLRPQTLPLNLRNFTLVVANPADTGPKHGVEVLLLMVPGRLGKIEVTYDPLTLACALTTSNVRIFRIPNEFSKCSAVLLDGIGITVVEQTLSSIQGYTLTKDGTADSWKFVNKMGSSTFPPPWMRWGRQLGNIDSILRTHGAFQIVCHTQSPTAHNVALQISRNLHQYFFADTSLTTSYPSALAAPGNVISVAIGADLPASALNISHAIQHPAPDRLYIVGPDNALHGYHTSNGLYGLAAIYLRPLLDERLELVVWGADKQSLELAARLVPVMTGTGVPDFVVLDGKMGWKGLEGALAVGWLDERWNVSGHSYF